MDLPPEIAKDRILNSIKENKLRELSEQASSAEEIFNKNKDRFESEQKRYWNLYKINNRDMSQYDLVIDTNKNNLEEVVELIIKEYKNWIES